MDLEHVISNLLESATNLLTNNVHIMYAKADLVELVKKLELSRNALKDADRIPFSSDQRDGDFERKLKSVLLDVQDIMEEYRTKIQLSQRLKHSTLCGKIQHSTLWKKVQKSSHFNEHVSFSYTKIKEVNKRLDQIKSDQERLELLFKRIPKEGGEHDNPLQTTQHIGALTPIGRQNDKEKVKKLLFHVSMESSVPQNGVSIISIVGQGGIGKTTLAKMVFDEVEEQFGKHRWWVCVSQQPNREDLLRKILMEVLEGRDLEYVNSFSLGELCTRLRSELSKEMFLLVLDDIWELDWWHGAVEATLMEGAKGSKILITSRKENVSDGMNAYYMHKLPRLTFDESWSLFLEMACVEKNDLVNHNLEHIANKIVVKCGGLPLVVQTVGSLMRTKKMNKDDWETIEKSEIWEWKMPASSSSSKFDGILPGLFQSYADLPPRLRSCFVYCCIYPEDHEIGRDELVMQWVAHGFVEERTGIDVEVIANKYIDDLIRQGFIEKTGKGNLKLHDILRDLAKIIGGEEYAHASAMEDTRHLSLLGAVDAEVAMHGNLRAENKLRTLLVDPSSDWVNIASSTNLKWLRVLSLKHCGIHELPDSIGYLSLLKYLDLSYSEVRKLPTSIGRLLYLQILNLNYSTIEELPKEIGELCNLRYLGLKDTQNLNFIAEGLGRLTNLRTLHKFIVCNDRQNTRGCNIKELKELKYIKGKLSIGGLGVLVKVIHANEAQLKEKHGLISVELNFKTSQDDDKVASDSEQNGVLEALEPPHGLENLKICHYKGQMPTWYLRTNLVMLRELTFEHCPLWSTVIGIPSLQTLEVNDCPELMCELPGMPLLNSLKINKCDGLNTIGDMPVLKSLTVEYSKGLKTLASMPALERLELYACDSLEQVVDMPSLLHLQVKDCKQLRVLAEMPALNALYLTSLPSLIMNKLLCLTSLEEVGLFNLVCSLETLEVNDCPELMCELLGMPLLKSLKINKCDGLNTIGDMPVLKSLTVEYSKGLKTLASVPALERLKVYACDSLEEVVDMPSLLHLQVKDCKQLSVLAEMPALKALYLTSLPSLPSLIMNKLLRSTSLKEVGLFNFENWEGWPAERREDPISMTCLIEASFGNCAKMKMQGLVHVLSEAPDCQLQRLAMWNCPTARLGWEFFKHLPNLITLALDRPALLEYDDSESAPSVPSLSEVSTFLPSLKSLCLGDGKDGDKWHRVPEWVWGLTQLEELLLIDFSDEVLLGGYWQCLQKLRCLRLSWFPKLKSLVDIPSQNNTAGPTETAKSICATNVQEQIARLSKLEKLGICHCPALHLPSELREGLRKRLLEHRQIDFLSKGCG